jgi:hypothetical protein
VRLHAAEHSASIDGVMAGVLRTVTLVVTNVISRGPETCSAGGPTFPDDRSPLYSQHDAQFVT